MIGLEQDTHMKNSRNNSGFTLIELMIVVAVVAIMMAAALPSYRKHVQRTARSECEATMLAAANALERRFTSTNTYIQSSGTAIPGPQQCPADGSATTYSLAAEGTWTATSFKIKATPQGGQTSDQCGALHLDDKGNKTSDNLTMAECWR